MIQYRKHGILSARKQSIKTYYGENRPGDAMIDGSVEFGLKAGYGHSQLMIKQILRDYEHAFGKHHAILRYFNAAGADLAGEIGEPMAQTLIPPCAGLVSRRAYRIP